MPDNGLELLAFASSFSRFAGPNNPILDLLNVLTRARAMSAAVVTTNGSPETDFDELIEFPVYRELDGVSNTIGERAVCALPNILRAKRAIARLNPRKLIVFSSVDTALEVATALRRPVIAGYNVFFNVPHPSWVDRLGLPFPRRWGWRGAVYRAADRIAAKRIVRGVFAHTEFHKRLYVDLGIPEDRIRIVPQCIDADRTSFMVGPARDEGSDRSKSEMTVLYAARLDPEKGVLELMRAAEDASIEVPLRLQIVGDGPLEQRVRAEGAKRGSHRLRIEPYPRLPGKRLLAMMRSADAIAIPSWVELFGIVALEAMALGRPIVATRFGGISEVVRDGREGILVNPMDRQEFAAALVMLAKDEGLRRRLGGSGRKRVTDEFDAKVVGPRFIRAMEEFN